MELTVAAEGRGRIKITTEYDLTPRQLDRLCDRTVKLFEQLAPKAAEKPKFGLQHQGTPDTERRGTHDDAGELNAGKDWR